MTCKRCIIIATFLLMTLAISLSHAADKVQLRAQDRVEIEQLMWDYIRALDSRNAEAYAALFTPDGRFSSDKGANVTKGREALKKMILDVRQKEDPAKKDDKKASHMYHVVTNAHIEFIDKDHARYHAYWMGALSSGGGLTSAGREVNELVKINGRWLISVRDVDPQD